MNTLKQSFPYAAAKKEELGIPDHQKSLLIYNVFEGQKTRKVLDLIEANHCVNVYVPANLTHVFEVLDLTINGVAKSFLNRKFSEWYAEQVTQQIAKGIVVYDVKVDTNLTVMKPVHAKWLVGLYDHLRNSRDLILKGFEQAGSWRQFTWTWTRKILLQIWINKNYNNTKSLRSYKESR